MGQVPLTCLYAACVQYLYLFTVEDQNFALFNYVNELNNEIEFVQEQIQEVYSHCNSVCYQITCAIYHVQIQQEIEKFKSQNIEMEEKRRAILIELEVKNFTSVLNLLDILLTC